MSKKLEINKLKQLLSSQLLRNVGWLGGAELVNRVFRLGTTVTLARMFSHEDYGLMAVVFVSFEFAHVFTSRNGIGAKIVQTDEQHLRSICNTSYWLNWILCGTTFVIQCIAAFPIALFYGNKQLILPLCTVALMYLMFPLFLVQSALVERENRLKVTALCHATQSIISNIITIVLAFLGMGVWSIVWAMVLSTPVWIVINYMNHPWRPPKSFQLNHWQEITNFGKNVLGSELLTSLWLNIDYLIVGKFLGVDQLGVYYFAFNAGSGITKNVLNAFISALYPHICAVRENHRQFRERFFSSIKLVTLVVVPLVLLQSALAPLYVPIIFGRKWTPAIPILIMICLSVIPDVYKWASSLLLKATDRTHFLLYSEIIYTLIFSVSILLAVRWGVFWVAATVLASHIIMSSIFSVFVIKSVFGKK